MLVFLFSWSGLAVKIELNDLKTIIFLLIGQQVGYSYSSLLESTSTGYLLHCRGWKSVYLYPNRPCFLGCATIDMHDGLVQIMKWASGLTQVAFSRFSPLMYAVSRMSLIQSMCYGFIMFSPLYSIPNWLYGTIPQMCLLSGIQLYPKVNSWSLFGLGDLYKIKKKNSLLKSHV